MEHSERMQIIPISSPIVLIINRIEARIENEYKSLDLIPVRHFTIIKHPSEFFRWHFVFHGPEDSPFKGGEYHGEIFFPSDFPYTAPKVQFNTYNGRLLRGAKVTVIEDRWWNCSMGVRDVLSTVLTIFYDRTPKPEGTLFEEEYRLRILAEKSQYSGCVFCSKEHMEDGSNLPYVEFWQRWKALEENTQGIPVGNWWNELREGVIRHEERELKRIDERHYELCTEKVASQLYSYILLLNWKKLARNVIAPIIYRLVLLPILILCFVVAIFLANKKYFDLKIRVLAAVDTVLIFIIGLDQSKALYAFIQQRQIRGIKRKLSIIFFNVALCATIAHVVVAIFISVYITDGKYTRYKAMRIIYIVTAFVYDIYHYIMGICMGMSIGLHYLGGAIEYLVTLKVFKDLKSYRGKVRECGEKEESVCNICKEKMVKGDEVYVMECNGSHIFHKQCLYEFSTKVKRCPMCKLRINICLELHLCSLPLLNKHVA
eukprot:TRINITY_DN4179_c0_g1_i3.p1 TRINITY_DN4179_c0_g1~~TRINITY_DN4179_c0_g1_i3.p1  ORF type:complete len:487 (+),score=42.07 TRINITY_DN4179_c0_g1_i3:94-1554(+)